MRHYARAQIIQNITHDTHNTVATQFEDRPLGHCEIFLQLYRWSIDHSGIARLKTRALEGSVPHLAPGRLNRCFQVGEFSRKLRCGELGGGTRSACCVSMLLALSSSYVHMIMLNTTPHMTAGPPCHYTKH